MKEYQKSGKSEHGKGDKHRGGGHRRKGHHQGAQTFRRGRAIDFLEKLNAKRATLKQQLEAPEFKEIKPVILGELKAIELVIEEFQIQFELHENPDMGTDQEHSKDEDADIKSKNGTEKER